MTTWAGWEADFLSAVSLPNTGNNRAFLSSWASNATHPNLKDNPVDLHLKEPGSTNGPAGPGTGQHFQNYPSHVWARTAWDGQLTSGKYPHLHGALESGDPYGVSDFLDVEGDLNVWGSGPFGSVYVNDARTGPPGSIPFAAMHKGWADLQHSVNRNMPAALRHSRRVRQAALTELRRARKVRG